MATSLVARPHRARRNPPPLRRHRIAPRWIGTRNLSVLGMYPIIGNATVFGMLLGARTAEITAELYRYPDLDAANLVATLSLSHSRSWQDVLSDVGAGSLTLQNDDPALASFGDDGDDVVVLSYRGERALAFLCERKAKTTAASDEEAAEVTTYTGRGHLALLERVLVYPSGGVGRSPVEDDRVWNFASLDFDDTGWTTALTLGTVGDAVNVAAFLFGIDPAEIDTGLPTTFIRCFSAPGTTFLSAPIGSCYFRDTFEITESGTYAIYFACDDQGSFWIDGQQVCEVAGLNWLGSTSAQVVLTAGTHLAAAHVENLTVDTYNPLKYAWGVWSLNGVGQVDVLVATGSATTKVAPFPSDPPGMTPGKVLRLVIEEAQARGYLSSLVLNFTDDYDSAGVPWPVTPNISTKTGTDVLTFVTSEVASTYCDVWMDPASLTLWAWNIDGRGAVRSITVTTPTDATNPATGNITGYSENGEYQPIGALLLRYRDGWAERTDAVSVATYGRREAALEIGAPAAIEEVYRMADGQFAFFATPRTELAAEVMPMADADTPYMSFRVGDQLTTPNGVRRVLGITMSEDNDTGRAIATLTLGSIIYGAEERVFIALRKS